MGVKMQSLSWVALNTVWHRGSGLEISLFVYWCCRRYRYLLTAGIRNLQVIGNLFQRRFMGEGDVRGTGDPSQRGQRTREKEQQRIQ